MAEAIPFDRLGIAHEHRAKVGPGAPLKGRMAIARGLLPLPPDQLLALNYVLLMDEDERVSKAAAKTLLELPASTLVKQIGQRTHPKILEYLARHRVTESSLMEKIYRVRDANTNTVMWIAERASGSLLESVLNNQERMLITPDIYRALIRNEAISKAQLEKVESFLRLNRCLPQIAEVPPVKQPSAPAAAPAAALPRSHFPAPRLRKSSRPFDSRPRSRPPC